MKLNRMNKLIAAALLLLSTGVISACVASAQAQDNPPAVQQSAEQPQSKEANGNEAVDANSVETDTVEMNDKADVNDPAGGNDVADGKDAGHHGGNEADEAAALAGQAKITADAAQAAALAANPGTTAVKVELGDENGTIIYSVELNNGADVKVDATSGAVLSTEAAGTEEQGDRQDQGHDHGSRDHNKGTDQENKNG